EEGSNTMPSASDDRMQQWQRGRAARLGALPWVHTDATSGRPVRYVAGELLVRSNHEGNAHDALSGQGFGRAAVSVDEIAPGFVRLRTQGMDVGAAARAVRRSAGPGTAAPNHVFLSTPDAIGGPVGPPPPADQFTMPTGPSPDASLKVVVVDTGIWLDTPLPATWYQATSADYDDTLDDDADVGHANFITGVIMTSTSNAQ